MRTVLYGLTFLQDVIQFAPEQLHRYALDWTLQKNEGSRAIENWEQREPGSIAAVLNAYAKVIPWIRTRKKLTPDDLKLIHQHCAAHLSSKWSAGEFRLGITMFTIHSKTSSAAEMPYFAQLYSDRKENYYKRVFLNNGEALQFLLQCGEPIHFQPEIENPPNYFKKLHDTGESFAFMGSTGDLNKEEINLLRRIESTLNHQARRLNLNSISINELKKKVLEQHPDICMQEYEQLLARLHHSLYEEMQQVLNQLYKQLDVIRDSAVDNKLSAIAHAVQALERIHPFNDVNCRSFCMVFLNILLIQNGFLPALIDDPNKFDGYDCHSLVVLIKEGIQRTQTLHRYIKENNNHPSVLMPQRMQWCPISSSQKDKLIAMSETLIHSLEIDNNSLSRNCCIS